MATEFYAWAAFVAQGGTDADLPSLENEVRAVGGGLETKFDYSEKTPAVTPTGVTFTFTSALTAPEKSSLDTVVADHQGVETEPAPPQVITGTPADGQLLIYDSGSSPPGFNNVTMGGDATIDEDGNLTLTSAGDVVGPASSTDNAVARFDLATGKLIQDSVVIIDDSGNITGAGTINGSTLPAGDFGDVVGPASSTDNAVARYDLATGKLVQDSVVLIDDAGNLTGVGTINGSPPGGLANAADITNGIRIISVNNTDTTPNKLQFTHLDNTVRAETGFDLTDGRYSIVNKVTSGDVQIRAIDVGLDEVILFNGDPDGAVTLYNSASGNGATARTATVAAGGFEVNNTVTGAGFGRALTVGDDALYVKLAGAQTITGQKTFTNMVDMIATTATDNLSLKKSNSNSAWLINAGRLNFFDDWLLFKNENEVGNYTFAITPSGQFRAKDGSAGAPSYTFDSGTNYGMSKLTSTNATPQQFTCISAAGLVFGMRVTDVGSLGTGYGISNNVEASAQLAVRSSTKGFLPPRMTTTLRNAIASPAEGLVVYNTNTKSLDYYDGAAWDALGISVYGEVYMQNNVTVTTISATNTPVKVAGTTTNGSSKGTVTLGTNRVTYTGTATRDFMCQASFTAARSGGAGSPDYTFYFAKNGTVVAKTGIERDLGTAEGAINIQGIIELATNDYVELWVENNTDTNNNVVKQLNLIVSEM